MALSDRARKAVLQSAEDLREGRGDEKDTQVIQAFLSKVEAGDLEPIEGISSILLENPNAAPETQFSIPQVIIRKFSEGVSGGLLNTVAARGKASLQGTSFAEELNKINEESKIIDKQFPGLSKVSTIAGLLNPRGLFASVAKRTAAKLGQSGVRKGLATLAGGTAGAGAFELAEKTEELVIGKTDVDKAANDVLQNLAIGTGSALGLGALGIAGKGAAQALRSSRRLLSGITPGLSQKSVETYAKNPKAVDALIREKLENFLPSYADKFNTQVKLAVKQFNQQIDEAVSANPEQRVSISPLIAQARRAAGSLRSFATTKGVQKAARNLDEQADLLEKLGRPGPEGQRLISGRQLLQLKRDLQQEADRFFTDASFKTNETTQALGALEQSADDLLKTSYPGVVKPLENLRTMIQGQKALGVGAVTKAGGGMTAGKARNILTRLEGKPEDIPVIQKMDEVAGTDVAQTANFFRASREVGSPDFLAKSTTGRSLLLPSILKVPGVALQSPPVQRGLIKGSEKAATFFESAAGAQGLGRGVFGALRKPEQTIEFEPQVITPRPGFEGGR